MPWLVMGALLGLALLSAALTWAARGYALRRQLFDQPGERRSHSVATPRGGGIAIVISLLVTAGVAMWAWPEARRACWSPALAWRWWRVSAGGTITGRFRPCAA